MKLGSLFDGSGTAPLAASLCGIEPVWASEIEPYPIRVTTKRFPRMKHLGDITKINGAEIEPVDIICGGSPCQDLSVAGKQAGLKGGKRSHLFFQMTRIIQEMRDETNGEYPRYVIWENVPGAFSSNDGYDFLAVLQGFAEIAEADIHVPEPERKADKLVWRYAGEMVGNGWSIAWRTLDAQYWGVPQRRRRIFLVTAYGGISDPAHRNNAEGYHHSERAGEILFEQTGLPRHFESNIKAREGTAENATGGAGRSDRACLSFHLQQDPISSGTIAPCLSGQNQASIGIASFMGGQGAKARSIAYCDDGTSPTLRSSISGSNQAPDVVYRSAGFNPSTGERAQGGIEYCDEYSPTLRAGAAKAVVYDTTQITSPGNYSNPKPGDPCHPLAARQHPPLAVYDARGNGDGITVPTLTGDHESRVTDYTAICVGNGQMHNITMAEVSNTLDCMHDQQNILTDGRPPRKYIVRRLTPLECCRLQGFPDCWESDLETSDPSEEEIAFWTDVFETYRKAVNPKGKPKTRRQILKWLANPYSDSASYQMWGNGMALPCMLFVMKGVVKHEKSNPSYK